MCIVFHLLLCVLLPPLAVLIQDGCTINFLINCILTILGWIPGIIHAIFCVYYGKYGGSGPRPFIIIV
uniref:Plasma membrane proteolipid 3 n=1 Tax=Panagrolaimus sp. PS1159 TaxID=55785 RepID=A0AC35F3A4_9BILA